MSTYQVTVEDGSVYEVTTADAPNGGDQSATPLISSSKQGGFISDVQSAFQRRLAGAGESLQLRQQGKQGLLSDILQTTGQAAGLLGDVGFAGLKSGVKAVTPDVLEKRVSEAVLTNPTVQAGMKVLAKGAEHYMKWRGKNPVLARNFEAVGNIAAIVPVGRLGQIAARPVATTAKGTGKIIGGTGKATAAITTGVPREVFSRATNPRYVGAIQRGLETIRGSTNPFLNLAESVATKLSSAGEAAGKAIRTAAEAFQRANPRAGFNVRPYVRDIAESLSPFKTSGITIARRKVGDVVQYIVRASPQSPFSVKEVSLLQELFDTLRGSQNITSSNLLALRQKISAAYDAIPLGVNKNPRPYHAAIMAMTQKTDEVIRNLLPGELRTAYDQYARVARSMEQFGRRIVDAEGAVKQGAEGFIGNIIGINKGELAKVIREASEVLGFDLVDEVQAIKDAQKLSNVFAATGSRTQDIARSFIAGGVGAASAGTPGALLGLAATSPRVVGAAALGIGRARAALSQKLPSLVEKALRAAGETFLGAGIIGAGKELIRQLNLSPAEADLFQKESGLNPNAKNPVSSAFGIWQGLKSTRDKYGKKVGVDPDTTNAAEQLKMARAYIKDIYQNAENAVAFWRATRSRQTTLAPPKYREKARQWIARGYVGY